MASCSRLARLYSLGTIPPAFPAQDDLTATEGGVALLMWQAQHAVVVCTQLVVERLESIAVEMAAGEDVLTIADVSRLLLWLCPGIACVEAGGRRARCGRRWRGALQRH